MPGGEDLVVLYREAIRRDFQRCRKWYRHAYGKSWRRTKEELADKILSSKRWDASWVPDATYGKVDASTQCQEPQDDADSVTLTDSEGG